ncbi:alpha/beta fold hydrolase [Methylobacterium pseudosasicola]|uniref:Pimeloyl-ACP methyl ester carboxylesterase n=1 Tax=Methylobacterium pseudosasicola TaxID=582667 RepID=A0A1I4F6I0_9HYPH|nr:alpha/beta hydrolase [Methylobacterium pseudosasicola]SFL13592.1 Pimeloyl-ACP methyl ester carboxylesterase [Methylobacterium pseudosasicola]
MSPELRSAHLAANGITLAYDSFGDEAAETILLIAGLGTQMIRWTAPFCRELVTRGYRVVRFDNRDTGRSTHFTEHGAMDFATLVSALAEGRRPELAYTLDDMASDALGLLDALSIRRAHIVGRSMGGMIAQILASEHPSRVLSLTSIMSATGNPVMPSAEPDAMTMMMRPAPDPVSDEAGFLDHGVAFARRIAGTGHPFDEEACRALLWEEVRRGRASGGFGRQLAAVGVAGDRRSRLAAITAPTLVIHGTDDPLFLPACGEDTAASIPDAKMMMIPGMGHDLPPSLYRAIADAIEQNARRSSNSASGE